MVQLLGAYQRVITTALAIAVLLVSGVTCYTDCGYSKLRGVSYAHYTPSDTDRVVCIYFDDGWKSQLNAVPYLDIYGYKASLAIVVNYTTKRNPDYMTWEEIRGLSDNGYDVQCHGLNHGDFTKMSEIELESDLIRSKEILKTQGFVASTIIYPYGYGYDKGTVRKLVEANYSNARTISFLSGNNTFDLKIVDRYAISGIVLTNKTSFQDFKQLVDQARGTKVAILTYHEFDTERDFSVTSMEFAQQMAYLHDNGFTVRLLNDLMCGIKE